MERKKVPDKIILEGYHIVEDASLPKGQIVMEDCTGSRVIINNN